MGIETVLLGASIGIGLFGSSPGEEGRKEKSIGSISV